MRTYILEQLAYSPRLSPRPEVRAYALAHLAGIRLAMWLRLEAKYPEHYRVSDATWATALTTGGIIL